MNDTDPLFKLFREAKPGEQTWADVIREIAAEHGCERPSDDDCNFILLEMTAFPCAGEEHTRGQIHDFFAAPNRQAYIDAMYAAMAQGAVAS